MRLENLSLILKGESSPAVQLKWNKDGKTIRHFRTFAEIRDLSGKYSTVGVEGHRLSGSGQFSPKNIGQLLETIEKSAGQVHKIIVDLRLESHGYVNGKPVAWVSRHGELNEGMDSQQVLADEINRLEELRAENLVINEEGRKSGVETVETEAAAVARYGFDYERLAVLDHSHPSDQAVDDFIHLLQKNPNAWIHVHCHVGKGRTTTFMALYDMYHNAKQISFDEILKRQHAIDGENLKKCLDSPKKDSKRQKLAQDRYDFLRNFYSYCVKADLQQVSWSVWHKQNLNYSLE